MGLIDDRAGLGFESTPEAEGFVEFEDLAVGLAGDEWRVALSIGPDSFVADDLPRTADSTQSSTEPKATSSPRFPGA